VSDNSTCMQGAKYDQVIEIDLGKLEPHINGPFTPDLATPLSAFANKVREEKWPAELGASLIGSCTNSSYEDMARSASICEQVRLPTSLYSINLYLTQ
jgi:aconitase A